VEKLSSQVAQPTEIPQFNKFFSRTTSMAINEKDEHATKANLTFG